MTKDTSKVLLTREQARQKLDQMGLTGSEFARMYSMSPDTVNGVLDGRKKGQRGEAHKAAVLLGIKDGIILDEGVIIGPLTA